MGRFLENFSTENCPFVIFPIQEDYFPVYRNNTSSVGKIKSNEIRFQVITAYTLSAAMIDSVRMNNALVEKIDQSKTQGEKAQAINEAKIYWEQLRMEHCNLREAVNLAHKGLDIEIKSLPV
ncbi:hypothetical protein AD953_09055 [Acetobacter malorum]|uniref:Uncharacterized protein n=2 Tax=Acetobacter malorum TaxID=178901 RepID=A0A149V4B0_9PROT|nr:hypothetical protein AD953_09055 [Acetobacter malorum]